MLAMCLLLLFGVMMHFVSFVRGIMGSDGVSLEEVPCAMCSKGFNGWKETVKCARCSVVEVECRGCVVKISGSSPLTIRTCRYIQMSGMVLGGMLEADHRIRDYEAAMRMRRRIAADQARWRQFEETYGKDDDE